jgi:S-(hydroxymethyl)glutathione dehydrogenase/alcohol dehydrogenase
LEPALFGVRHSDLHFASGAYPISAPCLLGHESASMVEPVGAEVAGLRPGDHVVAFNIQACGICAMYMADYPVLWVNQHLTQRPPGAPPRYSWKGNDLIARLCTGATASFFGASISTT